MQSYNMEGLPSFRAGAAVVNLNPPIGPGLAGYFHERPSKYIRDEICAHAVILQGNGDPIALVSLDFLLMKQEQADAAKKLIFEQCGLPEENVLLCATHTHTAPVPYKDALLTWDAAFVESIPYTIASAVKQAMESMFDAILIPGKEEATDVGSNRLERMRDGSEHFSKHKGIGMAGPVDKELLALKICDREGNTRAVIVNFAMHPDTIGGGTADFISADWPGEIGKNIRSIYGKDTVTVFLNGCCGDLNHTLEHPTRKLPRIPRSVGMGRALAGLAIAAIEQAEPMENDNQTKALLNYLEIPYFTRDADFFAQVENARLHPEENWSNPLLQKNDAWDHDHQMAHVPVQVLRCGELLFIGLPGEFFTKWGLELKHWSPLPFTFVVEQANGWFGYVPTTDQAARGAYGASPVLSRNLISDAGRQIVDRAQVLLCKITE